MALIALIIAPGAFALSACGMAKKDRPLQGYAEADLLYLSPREPGLVETLAVKEGDQVKAGALIFRLDVNRSNATLNKARANNAATGQESAAAAQAVREARAAVDLARVTLSRSEALLKSGYVPKQKVDEDRANMRVTDARLRTAQAQAAAASRQTGASGADVALAREQAEDRAVTAPADGRIEQIYRRPGELAAAGDPVVALLPPANIKLKFFAPEKQLAQLKLGGIVDVSCDGCEKGMTAKISFIAAQPQFTPPVIYSLEQRAKLVYLIEARPEHPETFRPGQPLDISVRR
jgi:HlyD family secretion protein